jgi:hypothetical protein
MLNWLPTSRLRPVLTVLGLSGLLALAACGGGSGAPNNPYSPNPGTPPLQILPAAVVAYSGVPTTVTITSGVAPFFAFTNNAAVLPVTQNVAGNTIVLLPNQVTADVIVILTVQDSANQTTTVAVTVKASPIFNSLTFAPSGTDCGTNLCSLCHRQSGHTVSTDAACHNRRNRQGNRGHSGGDQCHDPTGADPGDRYNVGAVADRQLYRAKQHHGCRVAPDRHPGNRDHNRWNVVNLLVGIPYRLLHLRGQSTVYGVVDVPRKRDPQQYASPEQWWIFRSDHQRCLRQSADVHDCGFRRQTNDGAAQQHTGFRDAAHAGRPRIDTFDCCGAYELRWQDLFVHRFRRIASLQCHAGDQSQRCGRHGCADDRVHERRKFCDYLPGGSWDGNDQHRGRGLKLAFVQRFGQDYLPLI